MSEVKLNLIDSRTILTARFTVQLLTPASPHSQQNQNHFRTCCSVKPLHKPLTI